MKTLLGPTLKKPVVLVRLELKKKPSQFAKLLTRLSQSELTKFLLKTQDIILVMMSGSCSRRRKREKFPFQCSLGTAPMLAGGSRIRRRSSIRARLRLLLKSTRIGGRFLRTLLKRGVQARPGLLKSPIMKRVISLSFMLFGGPAR